MLFKKKKTVGETPIDHRGGDDSLSQLTEQVSSLSAELNVIKADYELVKSNEAKLLDRITSLQKEVDWAYGGCAVREEEINFLRFRLDETWLLHEDVVMRNWNGDNFDELTCTNPFERIDILTNGDVYTCCSLYLKHDYFIGNIFSQTFDEIWNSDKAKKLRYSVLKGKFEYCSRYCKWLYSGSSLKNEHVYNTPLVPRVQMQRFSVAKDFEEMKMSNTPRHIALSCDDSCNLRCTTCRNSLKVLDKEKSQKLFNFLMEKVRPLLVDCEKLETLGSGEFFASKAILDFYRSFTKQEFPDLRLLIVTNAQLFTVNNWNKLVNLHDFPLSIHISIDAAKKETYEEIRLGAKWEVLQDNLTFISSIAGKGTGNFLCFNFVVQEKNFSELEDFVDMAVSYGANAVELQHLTNWGTFSNEEFLSNNVCDATHEKHDLLLDTLRHIEVKHKTNITIIQNIMGISN